MTQEIHDSFAGAMVREPMVQPRSCSTQQQRKNPVKYLLDELKPGETHFVREGTAHGVQSYLSHARRKWGKLIGVPISAMDSKNGVIIIRHPATTEQKCQGAGVEKPPEIFSGER